MTIASARELDSRYQLPTYAKLPLTLVRGRGVYVFDEKGDRYLDLYGGHAVASTGHGHPTVVEAVARQAGELLFYSNVVVSPVRAEAARRLVEAAGEPYRQVFFVNSGAEANEAALRIARRLTGRQTIVALHGSFHGRTLGAASVTTIGRKKEANGRPLEPSAVRFVAPEDLAEAERVIDESTAAVILEPIQSMAGVRELTSEFLLGLRRLTWERGALLIFDEVQTGAGRTGRYLYSGTHGVHADVVSLAKGVASGVPMGAALTTEEVARTVQPGDLGSTFGGSPLACAALLATLDVLEQEKILARVRECSSWLRDELVGMEGVEAIRGRGWLMGLKLTANAGEVQKGLLERKILTGASSDPHVLRLLPPLILEKHEAEPFLEAMAAGAARPTDGS